MEEIISVFVQESREQLAEMEAGLLRLEQNPEDRDNINGIFRAAHTIKSSAGVVECAFIVSFTHWAENLLGALRNGTIAVRAAVPGAALQAHGDALAERLLVSP